MRKGRRLHELEVLLILRGSAGSHLVDPFSGVALVDAELGEGREELIVAAEAGRGNKAAHGKGIDEAVVEVLIGGGKHAGEPRGGNHVISARGMDEAEACGIDTEAVLGCLADECFGIDGAGEMDVEVGAFGEPQQKRIERGRAGAGGFVKGVGGAGFRADGRGGTFGGLRRRRMDYCKQEQDGGNAAYQLLRKGAHDCLPV